MPGITSTHPTGAERQGAGRGPLLPVDLALGVTGPAWQLAVQTTRAAARKVRPAVDMSLHPPGVPTALQAGTWVRAVRGAGARRRELVEKEVSRRLDSIVPAVLDTVLDRLDLTSVVVQRVDLNTVAAAVLEDLDLVGLAEDVIDGVDLPEIIRESTGSMASETVTGARMQGISADEAVGRAVDRLLLRRRPRAGRGHVQRDGTAPPATLPVSEQAP